MRPKYETDRDLQIESEIAGRAAARWGYNVAKLNPAAYRIDFVFYHRFSGRIRAACEVKRRYCDSGSYDTFMISASKIHAGMLFEPGAPFILLVGWDDLTGWIRPAKHTYTLGMSGRSDRGDEYDLEPVYYFQINEFTMLSK